MTQEQRKSRREPTQGPWSLESNGWDVVDRHGKHLAVVDISQAPMEEGYANARLIAAAHEMFEALEAFMEHWGAMDRSDMEVAVKLGRAALAKAKGAPDHVCNANTYPDCCYPAAKAG